MKLASRLRVDEPDMADVGQLLLPRIADLDGDDGVPGGQREQRRPPVPRTTEVGDDDSERALPRDPRDLRQAGTDRRRAHTRGLRVAADGEEHAEQANPPLT